MAVCAHACVTEVECAWGEMVGRWGILHCPLLYTQKVSMEILEACAKLHNFCVRERQAVPERGPSDSEAMAPGGIPTPLHLPAGLPRTSQCTRRDRLAAALAAHGMTRRPRRS